MHVQPYLMFDGRCEEAIEFYRKVLGAKVETLLRFKDGPKAPPPATDGPFAETKEVVMPPPPPGTENKVMHASLRIGDTVVMASDGKCQGRPNFQGFSLSVTVPDESEAERRFAALAEGGQVHLPLTRIFFARRFGIVADRFGVSWMIVVQPNPPKPLT